MASYTPLAQNQGQAMGGAISRLFALLQAAQSRKDYLDQQQFQRTLATNQQALETRRQAFTESQAKLANEPGQRAMAAQDVDFSGIPTQFPADTSTSNDDFRLPDVKPQTQPDLTDIHQPGPAGIPADGNGVTGDVSAPTNANDATYDMAAKSGIQMPIFPKVKMSGARLPSLNGSASVSEPGSTPYINQSENRLMKGSPATQPNKSAISAGNPDVPSQTARVPSIPGNPGESQTQDPTSTPSALKVPPKVTPPMQTVDPRGPLSDQPRAYQEAIKKHYQDAAAKRGVTLGDDEIAQHYRLHQLQTFGYAGGQGGASPGTYMAARKTEYDPVTGFPKITTEEKALPFAGGSGGVITPEGLTYANGINDAIAKNPDAINAFHVAATHDSMKTLAQDKTGSSDQALATKFIQAYAPTARFNPQSGEVVGEGAESIPASALTKIKRAFSSQHLSDEARQQMVDAVGGLKKSAIASAKQSTAAHYNLARALGPEAQPYITQLPKDEEETGLPQVKLSPNASAPASSNKLGNSTTTGSNGGNLATPQNSFSSMDALIKWEKTAPNGSRWQLVTPAGVRTGSVKR